RGRVAGVVRGAGQRRRRVAEREASVVAHAVRERIAAAEEARMRRQRQRRGGDRALEEHSGRGESIQGRRPRAVVPVRAEMVGARRGGGGPGNVGTSRLSARARGVRKTERNEDDDVGAAFQAARAAALKGRPYT